MLAEGTRLMLFLQGVYRHHQPHPLLGAFDSKSLDESGHCRIERVQLNVGEL
jgi:hypothetical protein